ncbi:hypothetical protein [Halobacillus salinus]|uniref:Uncharacterized protein n=1 Tax=Halobacillus salinus TaxID=192814 RepID=A0A4Z0H5T6_9BACI|nr:hypothetical protein [Halobacillus salinus]TGB05187.1 hypothetical protein E4663_09415 [Halobacillus salinus]
MVESKTQKALQYIAWAIIPVTVIISIMLFNAETTVYSEFGDYSEPDPNSWIYGIVALLTGGFWATLLFAAAEALGYLQKTSYYIAKSHSNIKSIKISREEENSA